jgi:nucleotide-binding universal stress UspA family protein
VVYGVQTARGLCMDKGARQDITMIKDLIVNLSSRGTDDRAGDYAISLAREFDAHVSAVAFAYEAVPIGMLGDGAPEFIDELMKEAEENATAAVAKFEAAARGSGLSAEARWISASFAGTADTFACMTRRFDLSVLAQPSPDEKTPHPLIIEAALFDAGRPVLLVPYIQRSGVKLDRILVGWDGSRSAARAVGDALPFLKRAKSVEIVTVGERAKSDEVPGADIAHHLARHGVTIEVKEIVAADVDVANVLLSHANDISADLMVIGGYGHSRFREFVLGGVTRSILATMTIPTLLSH